MSTFPSVRDALDNAVAQTRATRDPAVAEKRTTPRLSIEELNELDGDQLMERLRAQRLDTRGPVTRFVDLIDAGRNQIAMAISPAAARKAQQRGDTASFGQPKVMGADILAEELGMQPGIKRAIAGFAIDVFTDPFTYAGPGLLKGLTKAGGAAVNIGRRGDRVLKKATKAVASGGEIKDAVTKRLYDEFVPPDITDAPARAAEFARRTRGGVSKGKDGQPSSSVIAEYYDRPANTAAMADDDLLKVDNEFRAAKEAGDTAAMQARRKALEVEDRRAAAVKDWVAEYGYGGKFSKLKGNKVDAAPVRFSPQQGVMFGDAGSQIFHVPFTEFGVWVPAFSSPAKQAVAARSMALVKEGKIPQALHMSRAWGVVQDGPKVMREVENAQAEVDNVASLNYLGDMNADSFAAVQAKRDSIVQEYNQRVQDLDNEYQQMLAETDVNKVQDLGELQTAAMMHDAALDQARLISTAVEANPFFDMIKRNRGSDKILSREAFAADPYKSASQHLRDMAKGAALGEPDLRAVQQDIDRLVSETEALRSQGYKSAEQFTSAPPASPAGEVFYRGDPEPLTGPLDVSKAKQHGISFTNKQDVAKSYGKHITSIEVDPHDTLKLGEPLLENGRESLDALEAKLVHPHTVKVEHQTPLERAVDGIKPARVQISSATQSADEIAVNQGVISDLRSKLLDYEIYNSGLQVGLKGTPAEAPTGRDLLSAWKRQRRLHGLDVSDAAEREFLLRAGFKSTRLKDQIFLLDPSVVKPPRAAGKPLAAKIRKGADDEYNRVMDTIINPMRANYEERLAERTKLFVETGYVEMQKAIAQLADEDIEAAMAASDAMNAYATALTKYADRTRGAMQSSISKQFDVLSESAKHMLGLDPETLGPSLFATPRTVAQNVFGDQYVGEMSMNLDAYKRTRLGNRRALINEPAARYKAARRGLADEQAALETADYHDTLARIIANPEYNISPSHYDDIDAYVHAKMIQRHPQANAYDLMNLEGDGPGPLLQRLERVQASGVLQNKALQKELDELADMANRHFGSLKEYEEASGLLHRTVRGYVPNTFDPQFAKLVAQNAERSGNHAGMLAESFQQARSTNRHRFTDTKGKRREFFVGDRHWLELLQDHVNALPSPEIKAIAEDLRETMAEHKKVYAELYKEAGGDMGLIDELLSHPVDAHELNQHMGRFNHLTGMNHTAEKVFSDNVLYLLQNRTGASLRAKARKDFQDIFAANVLKLNQSAAAVAGNAKGVYMFEGGQRGVGLGFDENGAARILIGDTVYRKLNGKIVSPDVLNHPDSLAAGLLNHMNFAEYMPVQQAEAIEGIIKAFSPENTDVLMNGVSEFNKLWKGSTLFHPAYVVGNIVGNHALLLQGRAPVGKITALYRQTIPAVTAHLRDAEWLANRKVTLNSQPTTMLEVVEQAEHYGVVGTGRTRGAMMDMYPTGELKQTSLAPKPVGFTQNLKAAGKAVAGMPGEVKQAYLRQAKWYAIHRGVDKAQPVDKIKFAVKALGDQRYLHKMFSPVAAMNSKVEDAMRLATFMGFMDDGMDAAQAARKTKEILLDYGDFTPAEASLRRYWMPFFAWIRLNGGYQLHQLFRNPKWAGMAPKLKEAVEEMVAGDEVTPEWARPMWMREELAMQVAMNPAKAVTMGSLIPTEPINRLGGAAIGGWEGIMGLLRFGASSLNPLAQGALSLGQGREMYTGRTIAPNMQGDLSPGEFIASQFRPVRELVPLGLRKPPLAKAIEEGSGAVAGRLLLGGRYQPFDRERLQFQTDREFKDRESGIRKYISIAEREGNKEASLAGRARLMALYQDHLDKGGKIPKWAQRQLAKTPQ